MPQAIGEAIIAWGLEAGSAVAIEAGAWIASNAAFISTAGALVLTSSQASAAKRKAKALAAANAQDRHITLRGATAPRREVLGRAITGGDLLWAASTGASKDTLVMIVAISAREITAVEKVFVAGEEVTLDGSGYVTTEPYTSQEKTTARLSVSYANAAATYTLPHTPIAGSVVAGYEGSYSSGVGNGDAVDIPVTFVSGTSVTLAGGTGFTGSAVITYQHYTTDQSLRILLHTGAAGQVVDPVVNALFPTEWDAGHTLDGIAYAVIIAKYSQEAFSTGLKNISFLVRGSKVYDPRTATTAWSDNPALLVRHVCTQPLDPAMAAVPVTDSWCIAAANVCDQTVSYTVDGIGKTRKRYISGTIYSEADPPKQVITELTQAMAGGWVFTAGGLRMRAGAYSTPVATLTDADFGPGPVEVSPRTPREQLLNVANAKAFDPDNRWQYLDVPEVRSSTYITEDGAPLPLSVDLPAVYNMAQAQQILAIMLREARSAFTVTASFRMSAYPIEVFDIVNLQLTRYLGSTPVPCLVLARKWSLDGLIVLTLRITGAAVYADGTAFDAPLIPPANLLPVPGSVSPPTGISITSDPAALGDATQTNRMLVSWSAITDAAVLNGGAVEIQYRPADEAEPASDWPSVTVSGRVTSESIRGLQQRRRYLVRVRAWNGLRFSEWSVQQLHTMNAAVQVDTPGIKPDAVTKISNASQTSSTVGGGTTLTVAAFDVITVTLSGKPAHITGYVNISMFLNTTGAPVKTAECVLTVYRDATALATVSAIAAPTGELTQRAIAVIPIDVKDAPAAGTYAYRVGLDASWRDAAGALYNVVPCSIGTTASITVSENLTST